MIKNSRDGWDEMGLAQLDLMIFLTFVKVISRIIDGKVIGHGQWV